jgi:predicted transposase YdaD
MAEIGQNYRAAYARGKKDYARCSRVNPYNSPYMRRQWEHGYRSAEVENEQKYRGAANSTQGVQ